MLDRLLQCCVRWHGPGSGGADLDRGAAPRSLGGARRPARRDRSTLRPTSGLPTSAGNWW